MTGAPADLAAAAAVLTAASSGAPSPAIRSTIAFWTSMTRSAEVLMTPSWLRQAPRMLAAVALPCEATTGGGAHHMPRLEPIPLGELADEPRQIIEGGCADGLYATPIPL